MAAFTPDEDVPRLVEEPVQERVDLLLLGAAQPLPGFEARVVDRGHELGAEESAQRLPHEVRRGDARDPEPVGDLRRDGRLAGPRRAADEDDDRHVELLEIPVAAETSDRLLPFLLAEDADRELLEAVQGDRVLLAVEEILLDPPRDLVRAHGRDPDPHEARAP